MKAMPNLYPIHAWQLEEPAIKSHQMTLAETLFSLANGYIGTRGTFEEGFNAYPKSQEGTYLNGVYVREPIHYEEVAYGFATHNNKLLQVPDAKAVRLRVDGIACEFTAEDVVSHQRRLDFHHALVERITRWKLQGRGEIEMRSRRIVSLVHQQVMAQETVVTPYGFEGVITLDSLLGVAHLTSHAKDARDPRAGHISAAESLSELASGISADGVMLLEHEVKGGGFYVASACAHHCSHGRGEAQEAREGASLTMRFEAALKEGESLTLQKYISYHHRKAGNNKDIAQAARDSALSAREEGFDALLKGQKTVLDAFWDASDVQIEGDDALQQGIRFNMLQIFLSSGKNGESAIAAKGLSGPGYDGHYFWDTEMYIVPFFIYSSPHVARALISYRYSILEAARKRAREMNHKQGALFAWRTISGEECSAYFPAGTAQYHINADIAYAITTYFNATQDWEFLETQGLEMLLEMARIWMDIGHFSKRHNGEFCIFEVTGPDEYTAMVDNNFYTNAMAQHHLRSVVRLYEAVKARNPQVAEQLATNIALQDDELEQWQQAAEKMHLPYDETLGIHAQDETFLSKPIWDFAGTPEQNYPLLLNYHPLVIYRHQVLKQADVVQAMALLGHQFDRKTRTADLNYYEPLTTHDSTLSTCIYSIECSRAGQYDKAYALFGNNVRMDIDNLHHNTEYGLHTACMAGSWMCIVMGFAGLEVYDEALHFAPHLPEKWQRFSCRVRFRDAVVQVSVSRDGTEYQLFGQDTLTIFHHGEAVSLQESEASLIPFSSLKEKKYA